MDGDYNVILENLPTDVRGVTISKNGEKLVLLNARLNFEMQRRGFDHEMRHIHNNDFIGAGYVEELESYTHSRRCL